MDEGLNPIVFDDYGQGREPAIHVYTNTPSVQLTPLPAHAYFNGTHPSRTEPQLNALGDRRLPDSGQGDLPFGASLQWPYRGYIVTRLVHPDRAEQALAPYYRPREGDERREPPLGEWPDQPIADPIKAATPEEPVAEGYRRICLFNVIVALEWEPDAAYLQQLARAFQRASDFLYDVTDGYMAFGQVAFGGPKLMGCADVQILASNRFFPRGWVCGLHEPDKYMPIRGGRGIWNKTSRFTIPWDEPEGYRALVHEWAHYALGLKDRYLTEEPVQLAERAAPPAGQLLVGMTPRYTLVLPESDLPIQSIMAVHQGSSELTGHPHDGKSHRQEEWAELVKRPQFEFLGWPDHVPSSGPWRLPLPLPYFPTLPELLGQAREPLRLCASTRVESEDLPVQPEHCWVYVVKGNIEEPTQIIAQGSLDLRTDDGDFVLLGATDKDYVVLVGRDAGSGRPAVKYCQLDGEHRWVDATPDPFPMVDVQPDPLPPGDPRATEKEQQAQRDLRRRPIGVEAIVTGAPHRKLIFPLGVPRGQVQGHGEAIARVEAYDPRHPDTLDGAVYVTWGVGETLKLAIAPYSQGGGPETSGWVHDNPTTAGSPEGNAMLFFTQDGRKNSAYSDLRVVTTVIPGVPDQLPDLPSPDDSQARSYTFSLASNGALPRELNPTLILFYDAFPEQHEGDLRIYRQADGGKWLPLPTYLKPGSAIAATPLRADIAGGSLVAARPRAGRRVERYRLYWTRRGLLPSSQAVSGR